MPLQVFRARHPLAIDIVVADVLDQLGFERRGIDGIAAKGFRELGGAQHAVFAVLAASEHPAHHVTVDRHYGEGRRHIGHADANVVLREDRPHWLLLQHVGVGGHSADDETGDAVLIGCGAGEHRAEDARAIRRGDGAQLAVNPALDHAHQVGQLTFEKQRSKYIHLHPIDTDYQHMRLGLGGDGITGQRESKEKKGWRL